MLFGVLYHKYRLLSVASVRFMQRRSNETHNTKCKGFCRVDLKLFMFRRIFPALPKSKSVNYM